MRGHSRRAALAKLAGLATLGVVACRSRTAENAADGTLLSPYLAIGELLSRDEVEGLAELGGSLVAASEGHEQEPGVAELLAGVGRVAAGDIATVRLAYAKMSEGLIAYLEGAPTQRAGLQLVFCPMALSNQGAYWVQREGKLINPYEGAMMLRCGARLAWEDHRRGAPPVGSVELEGMES